jgi:hypothetical protein
MVLTNAIFHIVYFFKKKINFFFDIFFLFVFFIVCILPLYLYNVKEGKGKKILLPFSLTWWVFILFHFMFLFFCVFFLFLLFFSFQF